MLAKKSVFIIPGFRQKTTNKAYKTIARMLKKEGYTPIPVIIPWKNTTVTQNTAYFLQEYKKNTAKKKYILGFSFGAVIAFLAATKIHTHGLILCSLSPYFKEDLIRLGIQKNSSLYQDFLTTRCKVLAKQIKAKHILMLYGTKETKPLISRVHYAFSHIISNNKYLIPIQQTEHNIGGKRYLDSIHLGVKAIL